MNSDSLTDSKERFPIIAGDYLNSVGTVTNTIDQKLFWKVEGLLKIDSVKPVHLVDRSHELEELRIELVSDGQRFSGQPGHE